MLLADRDEDNLRTAAASLEAGGHEVRTHPRGRASRESVQALANLAADLGPMTRIVHTAGLSPVPASAEAVLTLQVSKSRQSAW